jgi:hypothetical protein
MTTLKVKNSSAVLNALEDLKKKTQAKRRKSLKSEKKIKEFLKRVCG